MKKSYIWYFWILYAWDSYSGEKTSYKFFYSVIRYD